jgi:hypothetical protein
MKLMMRNWRWLVGALAAGLICATGLLAKIQTVPSGVDNQAIETKAVNPSPPDAEEAADAALLIEAVNAGDAQTALKILHDYGVAENTLLDMATRLGKTPARVQLKEPFLKASIGALAVLDPTTKEQVRSHATVASGYQRHVWVPRQLDTTPIMNFDADLGLCPLPPIAVLNVKLDDPCFIRFFKWYDRYAEFLHSVALNGADLSNAKIEVDNYDQANRNLNALFQLIKARKPDAFVWLGVVKEDDRSDEPWLRAITFKPDGLQISNLRQFHSPFAETYRRYVEIVGADTPMMVAGFYGQKAALGEKEKTLSASWTNRDAKARQAAELKAKAELGGIGAVVGNDLAREEAELQSLGYRGLSVHWLLHTALANSGKAAGIDKSDLINPRAGLLETCFLQKDYARLSALAAEMITNSVPGDMDWVVGKLYQGMVLLSQTPPRTSEASTVLDEVLAFDFKNRPGRDHYLIGVVKWRMYAATLAGDKKKAPELVQWIQNREIRKDLKSAFMKQHGDLLTQPTTLQNRNRP